ncbi:MAG: heimdallarchaeosortase [Candidatus Hodarchaeota archaeon]
MVDRSEYQDQTVTSQPVLPLGVSPQKFSSKESTVQKYDGAEIIMSFLAAAVIAAAIYLIPEYFAFETVIRDMVLSLLIVLGVDAWATPQETITIPDPAISIAGYTPPAYGVVRACTAMQAGAIILALIVVTKAPLRNKIAAGITFSFMIFVANILRLVFHLVLVAWGVPFWFAHDALSKVIGFIGTIIFALIIEKQGVPMVETFADWMEYAWSLISALLEKIGL